MRVKKIKTYNLYVPKYIQNLYPYIERRFRCICPICKKNFIIEIQNNYNSKHHCNCPHCNSFIEFVLNQNNNV